MLIMWCDLGESHMWHLQFSVWLKYSLGEVHFAENSTWIGTEVPRLWAIEGFSEQQKTIEIHFFSAADFQLIPLGRNTIIKV